MALKKVWNKNHHLNQMDIGGDYYQQQHQDDGNYIQYDYKSSFGGLSGRQIYATNKLPPLPRGPALAPPGNENRSGQSDYVDWYQCSTISTSSHQDGN